MVPMLGALFSLTDELGSRVNVLPLAGGGEEGPALGGRAGSLETEQSPGGDHGHAGKVCHF